MKRFICGLLCWVMIGPAVTLAEQEETVQVDLSGIEVLDMKTAQRFALAGNPDLTAAQARVEQARARVKQAIAAWWPTLDLTGSAVKQRLSDSSFESALVLNENAEQTVDNFSVGVQAGWVLFDGFFRKFNEERARYDQQSQAASLVNTRRLLVNSVAEAFLNAQLAQTNVDIAKADEAFYLRRLEDARNRYDVGAGPWGDILNIKVQLNSARTQLMQSKRQLEAAGYGLAALLGLRDAQFPDNVRLASLDQGFSVESERENADELISHALNVRPDVKSLELAVKQAEAGTEIAKAPFYPTVQLAGSISGARESDPGFEDDDFGSSVGVNMSWNLFSGGRDKAKLFEAKQAKREARYTLMNLRNNVASEVRQDIALLEAARDQVRLQRETVTLVEENRDIAKNEYEAGEASLVRLNEAQRDLTTTYGRLAQALVSYHLTNQRLMSATGRNLEGFEQPAKDGE